MSPSLPTFSTRSYRPSSRAAFCASINSISVSRLFGLRRKPTAAGFAISSFKSCSLFVANETVTKVAPGDVAARSIEAANEVAFDGIFADREDDRDRRGRRFGGMRRSDARRDNDGDPPLHEISGQGWQPVKNGFPPNGIRPPCSGPRHNRP